MSICEISDTGIPEVHLTSVPFTIPVYGPSANRQTYNASLSVLVSFEASHPDRAGLQINPTEDEVLKARLRLQHALQRLVDNTP